MANQIENIALFPLKIFLLPGEQTQLYIFEERYKQLICECREQEISSFGIVYSSRDNNDKLGAIVELKEVLHDFPDGEMEIIVQAVSIFKLFKFNFQKEGKLYPEGEITIFDEISNEPASLALKSLFTNYLLKHPMLKEELLLQEPLGIFDIAAEIISATKDKLELVQLPTAAERQSYLINYFRYLEIMEIQERSVHDKIYPN